MGFVGTFSRDLLTAAPSRRSPRTRPVRCAVATEYAGLELLHRAARVQPYAPALIDREADHHTAISISAEMTTGR
jgi:hypothetical protein